MPCKYEPRMFRFSNVLRQEESKCYVKVNYFLMLAINSV